MTTKSKALQQLHEIRRAVWETVLAERAQAQADMGIIDVSITDIENGSRYFEATIETAQDILNRRIKKER